MSPIGLSTSRSAQTKPRTPKLWLLLVGVKEYNDIEIPSLNYSAEDCQGLADALVEATTEFSQTELKIHHDFAPQGPLLEYVRDSLQKITTAAQSIDTILFYFSGHGIIETIRQEAFLCLADTQKSNLQNTGLALKEILQLLGSSAAQNQLVWLDACHSGGLTLRNTNQSSWVNPTSELVNVLQKQAAQSKGFYALLSCDTNQQSWEFNELGHGVFTYYLIRGLKGEAADFQGVISADGLYRYVYHNTLQYIDKTNQQLRLINQQKRNKGETQIFSEYPLQTPKRIVEGVGELILGKQLDEVNSLRNSRSGVVVEGVLGSKITLEISKLLGSIGGFELEYLQATKLTATEMRAVITRQLQANLQQDSGLVLLYLRGTIEETEAGEWLLLGENIRIKRSWLKQHLRRIHGKQIIILDCPTVEMLHLNLETTVQPLQDWVDDLQINSPSGQFIIAYASPSSEPELFARVLFETLSDNSLQDGLSAAGMIAKLQLSLADSGIPLHVSLSGTQGIIEVLPANSYFNLKANSGLDLGICPYMGLSAFCESDSQYFYGREDLTQLLLNQTANTSFIAVVGASGSGKSSIVQAGLIPALRQGKQIPNSQQWLIKTMRPGANPLETLAQKLMGIGNGEWGIGNRGKMRNSTDHLSPPLVMEGILNLGVESFVYWIRNRLEAVIVLVVDQFEELFTLAPASDREKFLELLLGAVQYAGDRFKLIVTLRADFIASCLEVRTLAKLLQSNSILVPPRLSVNDYRRVIINPARQVGLKVEPELVEVLLRELNNSAGDLPLLEFVLEQLWHHRVNGVLTLKAYQEKLGGISGALERSSQRVYESLDPKAQECAKWIFLSLTQLGEGTEDTRRRVHKSELIVQKYPTQLIERTLNAFTTAKLVVMNLEEEEGMGNGEMGIGNKGETVKNNSSPCVFPIHHSQFPSVTVEVAHEILLRHWSTLRWWLEENRARLRAMRQIEQATQLWKQNNQQADFLLQGVRLAEAEDIYIKYTDELSPDVQEFIAACLSERKRQQFLEKSRIKQKQRNIFALSILGITTVSFGALGYQQLMTAQLQAVEAANVSSKFDLLRNQQLEGLITSVKAGKLLKNSFFVNQNIKLEILNTLQKSLSNIQEANRIEAHTKPIMSVVFSPNGQIIASASADETVKLWSRNGKLIYTLSGHEDSVWTAVFSPSGHALASADFQKNIIIWNVKTGKSIKKFQAHDSEILSLAWSPQSDDILASASADKKVKIWRVSDGQFLKILSGHTDFVNTVAFSPDGQTIASGSKDNTIKIWRVSDGQLLKTLKRHTNEVNSVVYSPDGQTIASASADKTIKLWKVIDGSLIRSIDAHNSEIKSVNFSPNGRKLVSASRDDTIKIWNFQDGSLIETFYGHSNDVNSVHFSPTDSHILVSSGGDSTVRIWHFHENLITTISSQNIVKNTKKWVNSVSFHPQNNIFVTANDDKTIKFWRLPGGDLIKDIPGYSQQFQLGHRDGVYDISFSPDGKIFASAGGEGWVKLWRTSDGYMIRTLYRLGHTGGVNSLSFHPSGNILASGGSDKTIKLWDVKKQSLLKNIPNADNEEVLVIVFSPDGNFIASAGRDNTIKLWRAKDGNLIQTLTGHKDAVYSLSFNPQGNILASVSGDKTLKLWKLSNSQAGIFETKPYKTVTAHNNAIWSVSFHPDGKTLATASDDKTVKLWSLDAIELKSFNDFSDGVLKVSFSPDGKILASTGKDGLTKLWRIDNQKLQTPDLDNLMVRSCDWLRDYLQNNPNAKEQSDLCPNVED